MASVGFHGDTQTLDRALELTVNDLIKHLNHVQLKLRLLASAAEQDMPYGEELKMCSDIDDDLREMGWLFDDLRAMKEDLVSMPEEPEDKALLKTWKAERKELEKKLQAEHAAAFKEERAASKLALKMEKARIAEGKMDY